MQHDSAAEIYGDDFGLLVSPAQRIEDSVRKNPDAADVCVEQVTGLSLLSIEPNV